MLIKFILFIFLFIFNDCFSMNRNSNETNNITKYPQPYEESYYKNFDSFMFTKQNIFLLQKSLNIYIKNTNKNKNKNETVIIDNVKNIDQDENNVKYDNGIGNIYLKSIMYISDDSWSVWINDKKISNYNNLDEYNEFVIKEINSKSIKIIWTVIRSKWNYINSNNKIPSDMYVYNSEKNKVEFEIVLSPNQTFVASQNTIIDGKYDENLFKEHNDVAKNLDSDKKYDGTYDDKQVNKIEDNDLEIERLLKNL